MFVDWAGATIPVYDATTGKPWSASLFVAVLGASSYTYAEATRDQQLESWIQAHIHALEFFGGCYPAPPEWVHHMATWETITSSSDNTRRRPKKPAQAFALNPTTRLPTEILSTITFL